jgi:alpha-ketoglutarate-dependent taurine dioxygenase
MTVDADRPMFAHGAHAGWRDALHARGVAVLRDVPCDPDNAALRMLGAELGAPSLHGLPYRSGLVEAGGVQRVEALADAPLDQFGEPLLSGHHAAFPLHSDEAFLERPAQWVILHCWRSDADGDGVCVLADRDDAVRVADMPTRNALRGLALPYPHATTVTLADDGLLRYNRRECEGAALRKAVPLTAAQSEWLDRFDMLFDAIGRTLLLLPGDALVIDNHRMLHGRTAFGAGSQRLLKRLRIV